MSKVVTIMSMSLDGHAAVGGVAEVFGWYMNSAGVEIHAGGSDPMTFKVSGPSAGHLRGLWSVLGAVLNGAESVVQQAEAAGKDVRVRGADTIRQLLNAGLIDKPNIGVAAELLDSGVRLFDHLAGTPFALGDPTVTADAGVTRLRYPVRKA